MPPDQILTTITALCPDVDEEVIQDFLLRMDTDYFTAFDAAQISRHIHMVARLDPDNLCRVSIDEQPNGLIDVVVVAYDYFSEFAILCGLLSAFGLDIREGRIHTFAEAITPPPARRGPVPVRGRIRRRPGLSRKKIVDFFRVKPMPEMPFTRPQQQRFSEELESMIRLLDSHRFQDARHRVNRQLVETLGRVRVRFTGLLHPVQIHFDNRQSSDDTVMDIRSADTPAFLYAFANALTMRGVYIRQAKFGQMGTEIHDRFFVRGRNGRKIEDPDEQQELKLTATLIKQFTHFLTWAPDPAKALDYFDRFLDQLLEGGRDGRALDFLKEKKTLTTLARLLGTSDFLWEDFLRRQHTNLLPMLESYQRTPLIRPKADMTRDLRKRVSSARSDEQRRRVLNQYKDEEMFRIDMKHLLEPSSTLTDFSLALTNLADLVLDQSVRDCQNKLSHMHGMPRLPGGAPCPFAVFGMGKFGGRELGYASDIEVLFVYGGAGKTSGRNPLDNSEYFQRLAQEILQWIEAKREGIFHLDVRLRPHGGKGLLANRLDEMRAYYSPRGLAAPFERQALIKLRHIAGDSDLGRQLEAHRDAYVYSRQPWDLDGALALRRQQVKELVEPGTINIKHSPGALIDIEYGVQYLQIMYGHRYPAIRTPNTLEGLTALGKAGVLPPKEAADLRHSYLFFRMLIDGLRIVRGNAKDLILPSRDSEAWVFLARRVGYTTEAWEEGAKKLEGDIQRHMARTNAFFTGHFEKPKSKGLKRASR